MGTSIYIRKSAINVLSTERELVHDGCRCGEVANEGEYCPDCSFTAENVYIEYCVVEGLDILMNDFGDTVYHVANAWGDNRSPLLEFIRTKGIADEDWYEG